MEKSTTESIENFWSHFPTGLTYRELQRMSIEDRDHYAQNRAQPSVIKSEVVIDFVPESTVETSHSSAA